MDPFGCLLTSSRMPSRGFLILSPSTDENLCNLCAKNFLGMYITFLKDKLRDTFSVAFVYIRDPSDIWYFEVWVLILPKLTNSRKNLAGRCMLYPHVQ